MNAVHQTHFRHNDLVEFIWSIANKLRGPYRPPQYRKVMLPMVVLRRLDLVLEPTKEAVLAKKAELEAQGVSGSVLERALSLAAMGQNRRQPLYNTSPFTMTKLLGDPDGIARNLLAYIEGFSPKAKDIFDKFKFEDEVHKLDESNRLYQIVQDFCDPLVDLSPETVGNLQMGYLFENLVRRFNEQANEEAGDHFTPREVIRLMVNLVFTDETEVYQPGIYRSIYDPTAGTGGMLSVSEMHIKEQNAAANLELFGQEYNDEAYAICCADLLIKDEPIDNIVYGDTLGQTASRSQSSDYVPQDGHPNKRFHFMFANPPYGVEWKTQKSFVENEHKTLGFRGRFGPGTPRINDGSLLFLLHMISKMHQAPDQGGDGSKIAIVFNGSPLFSGDAGSGESNIRRWIIENDWLDAVVALPDQLFYNTGIYTYIWLVTNKKPAHRRGKVQLIDGTRHYRKMAKSMGDKRNELSDAHIAELTRLYGNFQHDETCTVSVDGEPVERICSKIFDNREFGYLKVTVERPLRLNFQASPDRIARLWNETHFAKLAESKKRKNKEAAATEIAEGKQVQQTIIGILEDLDDSVVYTSRAQVDKLLKQKYKSVGISPNKPVHTAVLSALSERDPTAEICLDSKGNPEPDTGLRDTELIPLPTDIELPLPLGYTKSDDSPERLNELVQEHCEAYLVREVLPHVPDAWIDHSRTKVGYEIPLNRHFYVYEPPAPLEEIEADIRQLEREILEMLGEIVPGETVLV